MKRYLAIGHFKENKNMTSIFDDTNSIKSFRKDLAGNGFVPYVIITEKMMNKIVNLDSFDLFEQVSKMTTNHRKWDEIADYIEQHSNIMKEVFGIV